MGSSVRAADIASRSVYRTVYESLDQDIRLIVELPINARKDLLIMARTQSSPLNNPRLKGALSVYGDIRTRIIREGTRYTPQMSIERFADRIQSPIFASYLSMLVRSLPFNPVFVNGHHEKVKSYDKEIMSTKGGGRPELIDYSVWFSENRHDFPLTAHLRPCPESNYAIALGFRNWKDRIKSSTRIYLPQFQLNKTVSRDTAMKYACRKGTNLAADWEKERVSTGDLERWYMLSGHMIKGVAEMRQAWKFNDLKPRTYYAQGGSAYWPSRFIRPFFNDLAAQFEETNFKTRFSIHRLTLTANHRLFIYDYSSFTSNLPELRYFIDALANFVRDVWIDVLDTHRGVIRLSLGDLLDEYNEACNVGVQYSVERLWEDVFEPLTHTKAGLLGIYGNIVSCTTLHGLHARNVVGDSGSCNCVGDDVIGTEEREHDPSFQFTMKAIQSLGSANAEKFEIWEDDSIGVDDTAWHYVKRPLDRFMNHIVQGSLIDFPIIGEYVDDPNDTFHTVKEKPLTATYRAFSTQVLRMIQQAIGVPDREEDDEILILNFLREMYRYLHIPLSGALSFESVHGVTGNFFPPVDDRIFTRDWLELLRDRFDPSASFRFPKTVTADEVGDVRLYPGRVWESRMNRELSFGVKMGFLKSEVVFEEVLWTFDRYKVMSADLMEGRRVSVYTVQCISEPEWWNSLTRDVSAATDFQSEL